MYTCSFHSVNYGMILLVLSLNAKESRPLPWGKDCCFSPSNLCTIPCSVISHFLNAIICHISSPCRIGFTDTYSQLLNQTLQPSQNLTRTKQVRTAPNSSRRSACRQQPSLVLALRCVAYAPADPLSKFPDIVLGSDITAHDKRAIYI